MLSVLQILAALAKLADLGIVSLTAAHAVAAELGMTAEQHAALDQEYVKRILEREAVVKGTA